MRYLKLTRGLINLAIFIIGVVVFSNIINGFKNIKNLNLALSYITLTIFFILLVVVLFKIKGLIKNVCNKKIFIIENVYILNKISNYIFLMAVVSYFIKDKINSLEILSISGYAITFETILLVVIGLVFRIFSDIFNEAVKIKEKSEVLEEENKYVI